MMRTLGYLCALALGACSFGNTSGTPPKPGPDAEEPPVCGDGVCAASEATSCPSDCGNPTMPVCGNGVCESTESTTSCPADCHAVGPMCGDGTCNGTETNATCPADCPSTGLVCTDPQTIIGCGACAAIMICTPPYTALACMACASSTTGCVGGAPNGVCDAGETHANCTPDCP